MNDLTHATVPGVDREALARVLRTFAPLAATGEYYKDLADAVLAYVAAHHECSQQLVNPAIENGWLVERVNEHTCGGSSTEWPYAHEPGCGLIPVLNLSSLDGWQECDREHADEWVEVDEDTWSDLPEDTRTRREWAVGAYDEFRQFVHRDDLPDPDADRVERMAKAIHASCYPNSRWEGWSEDAQEHYREAARAALAAYREGER